METTRIVAAIARVLGHGCAVSDEMASQAISLRHLHMLMLATAAAYNDDPQNQNSFYALEGWQFEQPSDRFGMARVYGQTLRHSTQTGRLSVEARATEVRLSIYAGPAEGKTEGRKVGEVILTTDGDANVLRFDAELVREKPHRIGLLFAIDDELAKIEGMEHGPIAQRIAYIAAKTAEYANAEGRNRGYRTGDAGDCELLAWAREECKRLEAEYRAREAERYEQSRDVDPDFSDVTVASFSPEDEEPDN